MPSDSSDHHLGLQQVGQVPAWDLLQVDAEPLLHETALKLEREQAIVPCLQKAVGVEGQFGSGQGWLKSVSKSVGSSRPTSA